ncbi:hypothetical protein Rs2_10641 [Raphanus sativus]|nr:hypothetical protein Rs2_10641 [Raphanus sativus]
MNVSTRSLPTNEGSLFFGSYGFVTAPYGDYWKSIKKLITTKLLGPQALERSRGVRAVEVNRFYLNLADKARKKESVEIGEEAMKLITNSMCKMLVGKSDHQVEKVRCLVSETELLSKKFFLAAILRKPLARLGISLFKKDLASISRRYEEVLEKILVEYEEEEHNQSSEVLDLLLEACQESKITRNHIKALFVDLFIAGTDTSTNTIQWTMAEIFNNPKILERLREEIDSVIENNNTTRLIQETDLPNLPYLQAVVKEGLRLHPPAPLVLRSFQEGCKVRGFDVLEKTTLIVNCYAVMRDPDIWEYPEEFKPERFLPSSSGSFQEEVLKYVPFGGGRRGCPGSNLALLE